MSRVAQRLTKLNLLACGLCGALTIVGVTVAAILNRNDVGAIYGGRLLVAIVLAGLGFLYFWTNIWLKPFGGSTRRYWISSATFSVLAIVALVALWDVAHRQEGERELAGAAVQDNDQVAQFLERHPTNTRYQIPTGVYLESIDFPSGYDVTVTGYVWQRYSLGMPKDIARGVVLPEADDAYLTKEAYRHSEGGTETIGWYFKAKFRQKFDYTRYPLDRQDVWIRMWPADFGASMALVPDFAAYPPWKTKSLLGLDPQMVFARWQPQYTVFSYVLNKYTTSLGHGTYQPGPSSPELYYNVGVTRRFQGPLFETLVPIGFVALLVFAALFVTTNNEARRPVIGFSTFAAIGFAVSMLLVIAVRQNAIRESTDPHGIVYLEYFSIAMYGMILLLAANAVFLGTARIKLLDWRENLLPALVYWPLLMGSLVVATAFTFFG